MKVKNVDQYIVLNSWDKLMFHIICEMVWSAFFHVLGVDDWLTISLLRCHVHKNEKEKKDTMSVLAKFSKPKRFQFWMSN